jgi:hypothetical protein
MPIIVVGGEARNIGKSSLVAALISRFAHLNWTAVKITSHAHEAKDCVLVEAGKGWSAWHQMASSEHAGATDTARFLRAGAKNALLLQADESGLADAADFLRRFTKGNVIVESTRIVEHLRPDCFLMIIGASLADAKHSSPGLMSLADAFVSAADVTETPHPARFGKPWFRMSSPGKPGEELWEFISEKLGASG